MNNRSGLRIIDVEEVLRMIADRLFTTKSWAECRVKGIVYAMDRQSLNKEFGPHINKYMIFNALKR